MEYLPWKKALSQNLPGSLKPFQYSDRKCRTDSATFCGCYAFISNQSAREWDHARRYPRLRRSGSLFSIELVPHQRSSRLSVRGCKTYSERMGSGASSVFGPNSLWRSRKRTQAFQRRIASSFPAGRSCSASPKSRSALIVQS